MGLHMRDERQMKALGDPRKAGHPVASTSERHGLVAFPRPWQVIDGR